jgi:alpha-1,3-rhamnosyltransferase
MGFPAQSKPHSITVMPANPKVSICIPSYNHAPFLPAALEGAISQTYRDIEIIVVDDGSTDDSLAIAESYAAKYPSLVKVFTHPERRNLGISATVNLAFQKSTGEYWSATGSDDILYPHKTEQEVTYLDQHPEVGWVYSYADYIDEQGRVLPGLFGLDISGDPAPVENLILGNSIPSMTVLVRRECLEKVGRLAEDVIYEDVIYGDWELWIRLAAHYKPGFIDSSLVKYRIHSYNMSVGIEYEENIRRGLEVLDSIDQNAQLYGEKLTEPRLRCLIDLQRARYLFCLGQREAAAEKLRSAFEIYSGIRRSLPLIDNWWNCPHPHPEGAQEFFQWTIEKLRSGDSFLQTAVRQLEALTFARTAMESYQAGDLRNARRLIIKAQLADARWLYNRPLVTILTETIVGSPVMRRARQIKHWMLPDVGHNERDVER